ncbi:SDR family NAD(P)-dependent oxidoreductase [Exercitatus varius]|uniref:SDR family NAD(P)-dependent oxidoreductase n=1 Tax=Exercitatus varius TaxID=67857 RepID=UPI00294B1E1C|nr:SDR family NAD(P)-dependent oxidoreductase [Exercitatus varius]MDG2951659.1 SDR family NAD(P)-dependent oxidoreductase [Exercitatus varius]
MTQKWLVTGASGGLGLALAKEVLAQGQHLVAAVRRPESLAELAAQFPAQLTVEKLDVTDIAQIYALACKHQDIDVIVNNAGGAMIGAMEEHTDADIRQQLDLNLLAPIHISRAFLPQLRAKKAGKLVFVTSIGGRTAFAGGSMYHAAKFGLEGFAEALAQEIAEFGIQTLIIEPGSIKSNFLNNIRWTEAGAAYQGTQLARMRDYITQTGEENISGDPAKMAGAIYNLCQQAQPPLRTALGIDAFSVLQSAYRNSLKALEAQEALAASVAIEGKTGFNPNA